MKNVNMEILRKIDIDKLTYVFKGMILIFFFFGFFVLPSKNIFYDLLVNGATKGTYLPTLWIYIMLCVLLFLPLKGLYNNEKIFKISVYIFIIAFVLRLILSSFNLFDPMSDFKNYYDYGVNIYNKNYDEVARIVGMYNIPTMGGLAVFNSILMRIFSTTLFGLQLSNCFINAFTCVAIFHLFKFKNVKIGAISGFLYAIYPANIISTPVTSNTHGAVLFSTLALVMAVKAYLNSDNKKIYIFSILSMIMFVIGSFFHLSAFYIPVAAMFVCVILVQIKKVLNKEKMLKQLWVCILIISVGTSVGIKAGLKVLQMQGVIYTTESQSLAVTMLVGLNLEDSGRLGTTATAWVKEVRQLDKSQQFGAVMEKLKSQDATVSDWIELFTTKQTMVWFNSDSWTYWLLGSRISEYRGLQSEGTISAEQEKELQLITNFSTISSRIDFMYIYFLYILCAIGICLNKNNKVDDLVTFAIIIILGWIALFMITEVQARYRTYAMPMFMFLGAVGINNVGNILKSFSLGKLKKTFKF